MRSDVAQVVGGRVEVQLLQVLSKSAIRPKSVLPPFYPSIQSFLFSISRRLHVRLRRSPQCEDIQSHLFVMHQSQLVLFLRSWCYKVR